MVQIVVYIDIYFLINYIIDYLVLSIVIKSSKEKIKLRKIMLGALVGAVYAVITKIVFVKGIFLILKILSDFVVIPFLMSLVILCKKRCTLRRICNFTVRIIVVGVLLGGLITALSTNYKIFYVINALANNMLFLIIFFLTLLITDFLINNLVLETRLNKNLYEVKLKFDEKKPEITLMALYDTGNHLMDSNYKKPVYVMNEDKLPEFEADDYQKMQVHFITSRSIGAKARAIMVVKAQKMKVFSDKKCVEFEDVLIGISRVQLSSDGRFDMLLNSEISEVL